MRRAKVALKSDLDTTDPEVFKGRWRNAWFRTDASEIPLPDSIQQVGGIETENTSLLLHSLELRNKLKIIILIFLLLLCIINFAFPCHWL